MSDNIIKDKSFAFALRIIRMYQYLREQKSEFVLSKQVLRSGTSIGANVREAEHAQSDADFIHKMNIALKEANETEYWLELLFQSDYIEESQYDSIIADCRELNKLLISIVKTMKKRVQPMKDNNF
ncbi:MAG: four helix bundle protein [Bacteroidaceae bacterium]|nr:four helix bundle protein [Bacteroidaceae bacterium]